MLRRAIDESEGTLMMWGYGSSSNWLSMTLMILGSVLGIVLLILLVLAVMRWQNQRTLRPAQQPQTLPGSGPTALEILNQRYARGEIDATTFEQMREQLGASDNASPRSQEEGRRPAGERLFDGY